LVAGLHKQHTGGLALEEKEALLHDNAAELYQIVI